MFSKVIKIHLNFNLLCSLLIPVMFVGLNTRSITSFQNFKSMIITALLLKVTVLIEIINVRSYNILYAQNTK